MQRDERGTVAVCPFEMLEDAEVGDNLVDVLVLEVAKGTTRNSIARDLRCHWEVVVDMVECHIGSSAV
jgi:hypothetical protein